MKIKLATTPPAPTPKQICATLKDEIETWARSYPEADGVIRDPKAIKHIVRLKAALRLCASAVKKKGT